MRGNGNIRQRADGRYEARYVKGRDQRGRALYASCYGRTYEDAERAAGALLRALGSSNELSSVQRRGGCIVLDIGTLVCCLVWKSALSGKGEVCGHV